VRCVAREDSPLHGLRAAGVVCGGQSSGGWAALSPGGGMTDTTSRLARKLRDMYRMPSNRDVDASPQARGVKDILQARARLCSFCMPIHPCVCVLVLHARTWRVPFCNASA
jgi:hypothetical protein